MSDGKMADLRFRCAKCEFFAPKKLGLNRHLKAAHGVNRYDTNQFVIIEVSDRATAEDEPAGHHDVPLCRSRTSKRGSAARLDSTARQEAGAGKDPRETIEVEEEETIVVKLEITEEQHYRLAEDQVQWTVRSNDANGPDASSESAAPGLISDPLIGRDTSQDTPQNTGSVLYPDVNQDTGSVLYPEANQDSGSVLYPCLGCRFASRDKEAVRRHTLSKHPDEPDVNRIYFEDVSRPKYKKSRKRPVEVDPRTNNDGKRPISVLYPCLLCSFTSYDQREVEIHKAKEHQIDNDDIHSEDITGTATHAKEGLVTSPKISSGTGSKCLDDIADSDFTIEDEDLDDFNDSMSSVIDVMDEVVCEPDFEFSSTIRNDPVKQSGAKDGDEEIECVLVEHRASSSNADSKTRSALLRKRSDFSSDYTSELEDHTAVVHGDEDSEYSGFDT